MLVLAQDHIIHGKDNIHHTNKKKIQCDFHWTLDKKSKTTIKDFIVGAIVENAI